MNKREEESPAEKVLFTQSIKFRPIYPQSPSMSLQTSSLRQLQTRHDLSSDSKLTRFGWNRPEINRATIDPLNFIRFPITHIEGVRDYSRTWLELA